MAPKTAKSKKVADVKVSENDAPKKGRAKAKDVEEVEQEQPEVELNGKAAATDKKTKRGKKANESNGQQTNTEETAPPAKRGRKKQADEPVPEEKTTNGDHSHEEEPQSTEQVNNGDESETNGHVEEVPVSTGKGRKKQIKKEVKPEVKPKETTRGRKAKQEIGAGDAEDTEEIKENADEKPKSKGRGRKAQPKADVEPETEEKTETVEEEVKAEPAQTKGRKKAQPKEKASTKEKTPESEKEEFPEEIAEEQPAEEPKKKETKGKKGQGKKAQAREISVEKEEVEKAEPASKKRKINKKDEKGSGDAKDEKVNEEVPESKPKGKRGKKVVEAAVESPDEEPQDTGEESVNKRKRKPTDEKAEDKKPAVNKHATNYEDVDFTNNSKTSQGKEWNFKIASWNVDGIRAWLSKGGLDYLKYEKPDILCLQEVKCAQNKLPEEVLNVPGYHAYWLSSDKDGYAGVCIYTTRLAMNVQYGLQNPEFDEEGRIITAEYEHFYLICTYVPNAGRGLVTLPKRLKWNEEFRKFVKELDKKKPVIICGDMNVAHNEIDLANPKSNKKNAGFTPEERAGMTELLGDGFVDTFRHLYPERAGAYTFWSFMKNSRAKNVGWRIDYFIVSERALPSVCDNVIRDQVYGSDHCPLTLFLHLSSADKPTE